MSEVGIPLIVLAQAETQAVETVPPPGEAAFGEKEVFPPFNTTFFPSQLLWLAITFVVLYLVVMRVALPRLGGILEDRRDRIVNDLDQADRLKQESNDAIAAYEQALAQARADAFALAEKARDAAKARAAEKQAEVEADLNAKLAAAETRIGEIKKKALAEVDAVASDVAEAVVERLLGTKAAAKEISDAVAEVGGRGTSNA